MKMNHIRYGTGKPLLLIHGIGGSWRSWTPVLDGLGAHREVIAIDLPGSGKTPPLNGETSIATLADAVTLFLERHQLTGIDAVGSSMGARLVLELVRRGTILGSVVSLNPGGFWQGIQTHLFYGSIAFSIRLIRLLKTIGALSALTKNSVSRSLLFAQFSAHPWKIPAHLALDELNSYAASPTFNELLYNLAYGERQKGCPARSIQQPLVIGWGRQDRVCFPVQAKKALELFPDATLHWFEQCGHFPQWDQPQQTIDLILKTTHQYNTAMHAKANATL
ncbi:MAG TPA: alpha/beta fold hydrolase [Chitinophagaceae bacterium]|nr:alpha/beta fold hydrolase [Chitinophagaceae bacterium]